MSHIPKLEPMQACSKAMQLQDNDREGTDPRGVKSMRGRCDGITFSQQHFINARLDLHITLILVS